MGVKLIELRPDRNLLKYNFDGYKLSLDPVPIIREEHQNPTKPNRDFPNVQTQYSFLHQELFGHQNLLVADPWTENSVYYVTICNTIENVRFDGKISRSRRAFQLPGGRMRSAGDYNYSMQFVNEEFIVVSNGAGRLYLIQTGERKSRNESTWKLIHDEMVVENDGCIIKDAQMDIQGDRKVVNVLLLQIIADPDCSEKFMTKLIWIRLKEKNGDANWERESLRELVAKKTIVPYCAFIKGGDGFIVASQKSFKFIADSEKEIQQEVAEKGQLVGNAFTWTQSDEDIVVNFTALEDSNKSDFYVKCSKDSILVKFKELILIDSQLSSKIDPDLTTWNLQNDCLQLTMVKAEEGQSWESLIPDGPAELKDSDAAAIIAESFNPSVPNLTTALEDCDRDDGEFFIEEIDAYSHSITHRIFLGSNAPLFTKSISPDQSKAIALRHDVDTCMWNFEGNSNQWRHLGTLDAFAYVAASKTQRKFVECSPDMNYSVICEPERHVFIYKNEYGSAGQLRNRSGNQVKFGQQKLVILDDTGEVIGMVVQNETTFLLTPKFVLCMKVNE